MEEDEQDQEVPEAHSPVEEEGDEEEAGNEQEVSGVSQEEPTFCFLIWRSSPTSLGIPVRHYFRCT